MAEHSGKLVMSVDGGPVFGNVLNVVPTNVLQCDCQMRVFAVFSDGDTDPGKDSEDSRYYLSLSGMESITRSSVNVSSMPSLSL